MTSNLQLILGRTQVTHCHRPAASSRRWVLRQRRKMRVREAGALFPWPPGLRHRYRTSTGPGPNYHQPASADHRQGAAELPGGDELLPPFPTISSQHPPPPHGGAPRRPATKRPPGVDQGDESRLQGSQGCPDCSNEAGVPHTVLPLLLIIFSKVSG